MNIDWNEIKDKYPEFFEKFKKFITGTFGITKIIEEVCYCDIERFFDDNGIHLNINCLFEFGQINYEYSILFKKGNLYQNDYSITYTCNTRDEAKKQAIEKSFEILEDKLNAEK